MWRPFYPQAIQAQVNVLLVNKCDFFARKVRTNILLQTE